jgi:hypothetical protein
MARERRKIILSKREVIDAVRSFRRVNHGFLPFGNIVDCTIAGNGGVSVAIAMAYGQETREMSFALKESDVLELLIRFCIENNIRIPKHGAKAPVVVDGELALAIRLDQSLSADTAAPRLQVAG